jgi:hypothetical protein
MVVAEEEVLVTYLVQAGLVVLAAAVLADKVLERRDGMVRQVLQIQVVVVVVVGVNQV